MNQTFVYARAISAMVVFPSVSAVVGRSTAHAVYMRALLSKFNVIFGIVVVSFAVCQRLRCTPALTANWRLQMRLEHWHSFTRCGFR